MKIIKSLLFLSFLSLIFLKSIGQSKKDSLFVFVGEKIEVIKVNENPIKETPDTLIEGNDTSYITRVSYSMDGKYFAKYKILKPVYGSFAKDTIEFVSYDHYGTPGFSKYKNVLLYVVLNEEGKFYHVKYQYADVYLAKNGRWASGYKYYDYRDSANAAVQPEKINFKKQISYKVNDIEKSEIERWYPKPYYKIKDNKAFVVYGNYIEELFLLKKNSVLKARGFFE
jgi:hypothetical protein